MLASLRPRAAAALRAILLPSLLACTLAAPALAQSNGASPGTYMLEGGSYTLQLEVDGGNLTVHEPNKDSTYVRQADGSYHFYNPNTDTVYGLRVIDARTIEAFKPFVEGNTPSRLVLIGGTGADTPADLPSGESERYEALAQHYSELAQSDSDNVQVWTACSAAALKRSLSTTADADAYAGQMAQMLKLLMTDGGGTPCADAIPASVW